MHCRTELETQIYHLILNQDKNGLMSLTDEDKLPALKIAFASVICSDPEHTVQYVMLIINIFILTKSKSDKHRENGWIIIAEMPGILAQLNCINEAIAFRNQSKKMLEEYLKYSLLPSSNANDHLIVSLIPTLLKQHHSFTNYLIINRHEELLKKVIIECKIDKINELIIGLMLDPNTKLEDLNYLKQFYPTLNEKQLNGTITYYAFDQGRFHFVEDIFKDPLKVFTNFENNKPYYSSLIYKHLNTPAKARAVASSLNKDEFWNALCKYATNGKSESVFVPTQLSGSNNFPLFLDNPLRETVLQSEEYDIYASPKPSYFKFQREHCYNDDVCDAWLNKNIRNWILYCGGMIVSTPGSYGLSVDVFLQIAKFLYPKELSMTDLQTLQAHKYRIFLFHDLNNHLEKHEEDEAIVKELKNGLLACDSKVSITNFLEERKNWFSAIPGSEPPAKKQKVDLNETPDFFESNIKRLGHLF